MKAIRVHQPGGPEMLSADTIAPPEPGPGQIRVAVAATGINFIEVYQRTGAYPRPLPFVLGAEFSGTVDAVGEGVNAFSVGDRVATASGTGGYAEFSLAPADRTALVPDSVDFKTAAAVMLQGMTAHYLTHSTIALKPGDTVLVHAGAGGVGLLLIQIAKKRGAKVLTTVSSDEKAALARGAGADHVINYTRTDFEAEVERLVGKRSSLEVVYDSVGRTTFEPGLRLLRPRGLFVLFGQSSGAVAPVDPQLLNKLGSLYLTRPTLGDYLRTREEFQTRVDDLFSWIAAGSLNVRIDSEFPLDQAAEAHRRLESRASMGKILLVNQ
jgi:NADPH2:quinone reductase